MRILLLAADDGPSLALMHRYLACVETPVIILDTPPPQIQEPPPICLSQLRIEPLVLHAAAAIPQKRPDVPSVPVEKAPTRASDRSVLRTHIIRPPPSHAAGNAIVI